MSGRDGGPAFPGREPQWDGGEYYEVAHPGMTLRQWYAGQALAGFIASYAHPQSPGQPTPEAARRAAFEYADAMLAADSEAP